MDKWALLSATQALAIYVMIRLDEGETDYNNFDTLLLSTVMVSRALPRIINLRKICYGILSNILPDLRLSIVPILTSNQMISKRLNDILSSDGNAEHDDRHGSTWKDWVLAESRRR